MSDSTNDVRTVECENCERSIGYNVATHIGLNMVVCEDCLEELGGEE